MITLKSIRRLYRRFRRFGSPRTGQFPAVHEAEISGLAVYFHSSDPYSQAWFYPRYLNEQLHEEVGSKLFCAHAQTSSVVADIGSNLGWFTCIAGVSCPTAAVHSFEMDSRNIRLCEANIRLNKLRNVKLNHCAVSDRIGEIRYESKTEAPSATYRIDVSGTGQNAIQSVTLDSYFAPGEGPQLIKIDVEGAEQMVLEGMRRILTEESLKTILIELHPRWIKKMGGSVAEVVTILENAAFQLSTIDHRTGSDSESQIDIEELEAMQSAGRMFIARRR